jgi:DNA-binding NtrC family response regulator
VEDDTSTRRLVRAWLEHEGCDVIELQTGGEAIASIGDDISAICVDLGLEDMSGLDVLRHLHARLPDLPVIVVTAKNDVETAVEAMRSSAYDFVSKPLDASRIVHTVRRAVERRSLQRRVESLSHELDSRRAFAEIVGTSPAIRDAIRQVERIADSNIAACVSGESGTGKELIARAIHESSRRRGKPFVAINCAAIPASLQESELFGHERGAFTGAVGAHRGRFEQAHGGTLFLDEIGEMSPATQAALLRTLQEKVVRRVGGDTDVAVDVRIVCATHRDLEMEVREGRFREDLYFRLVVYPIQIPPLRARKEDIPALVGHALRRLSGDVGRTITRIAPDALEALMRHDWPGNVRELMNVVHRAMLACDGAEIGLGHLPQSLRELGLPPLPQNDARGEPAARASTAQVIPLRELERSAILSALKACSGSVTKAARLLGIGRATLYRRLTELDVRSAHDEAS